MSQQKSTPVAEVPRSPNDQGKSMRRRSLLWRRALAGLFALCLVIATAWYCRVPSMVLKFEASRQLQRGRPYNATEWLDYARKLNGNDGELEFLMARTYRLQGDMNLTRSHLKTAWNLGVPVARIRREETLALAQSGQCREADPELPGLLMDARGDMSDICEAYVTGYIRTYRLGQANQLLNAWLADAPQDPRALLLRAKMQIKLLNWNEAERDLRSVLAKIPDHSAAADLLAGIMLKQRQPEEALKILPVAIKDPRTRLSAWLREVECYRVQGNLVAARSALQSILKEFPDCMQAHLDLGSLESDAGSFEVAVTELERARELAPNSPDVRYALAIALRGAGRDVEAKEHFAYVTQARAAVDEAMNLRRKVEQAPADAELRSRIGTTLLDYGQTERGLVWLQSALDVNPRIASAHQRLAKYYESRAKESEAFAKLAQTHRQLASKP